MVKSDYNIKKGYYYDISDDLEKYPEAWCYIIIGGRNCGKTYSALKNVYLNRKKFCFLKRTGDDVDLLTSGSGKVGSKNNEFGIDLSPFKSINRDLLCDVRAYDIKKGLGAFYEHLNGELIGTPLGYLLALNYVSKFKGFDLSDCDYLIFDEFIPQPWDRVNRKEGEQLLDLYKTISRDREHRSKGPLKLLCLANAVNISNPVMNILEITNDVAFMQISGLESRYIEHRGIFIHIINDNPDFVKKEKDSKIYAAMGETAWGRMAFDNQFAYNDFSAIGKTSLKGYKPVCSLSFKNDNFYIYMKDGNYYMTTSRHDKQTEIFNLNRENDQKLFFNSYIYELKEACINGKMLFEEYTMYDLIINYRKFFNV